MTFLENLQKSTHKVEVVPVTLEPHPNADSLSVVRIFAGKEIGKCLCGCGQEFYLYDSKGRKRKYLRGHNPVNVPRKYKTESCSRCGRGLSTASRKRWVAKGLCQSCYGKDIYRMRKARNPQFEKNTRIKARKRMKETLLEIYGARCCCCGEDEKEFLCLDHINGGGAKHRKTASMDSIYRLAIRETPASGNYRILCFNCNMARGLRKFCPHERILGPLDGWKKYEKKYA
jgi:hypothetical protein